MVEPVSYSAGKARIQRSASENPAPVGQSAMGSSNSAAAQTSRAATLGAATAMLSLSAAAKALPSELKSGPPIDIESVNRIREAISENRYPVDLKAITESLFQSFLEVSR